MNVNTLRCYSAGVERQSRLVVITLTYQMISMEGEPNPYLNYVTILSTPWFQVRVESVLRRVRVEGSKDIRGSRYYS